MELRKRIQSDIIIFFLILTTSIQSIHTRLHGRRHKRQHGAHLYLPESYIIPHGEGNPNEWGPWGPPSECSRTCGGGVAYQTRECQNIGPDERPRCSGGNKKYFSCNSQDCPENELDFRSQQCAHFATIPIEGVRYDWIPYTKAPNPCELNCMPRGQRFYYRHKLKVIDGTRCNDESLDVCVDGVCQPVGCDMMLGSSTREDKCRKCAGDGTSCKTISGLLDMNNLQVGYNDILLIPSGATNINIEEVSPSNNYLAVRNHSGDYYLNGNWRIDFPRPLTFAGAIWHYDRKPQGFAAPDHITSIGPTTEPVYLVLLYQDRNVGIKYEYSVPEGSAHLTEPDQYSWTYQPFTACSNTCGGGFQTRTVKCNSRTTLEEVDMELCDLAGKPADSQQCGQVSCPPRWAEGHYTKCSEACGNNGTQTRDVHCEHVSSTGNVTEIDDSVCLDQVGNKPATVSPCNIGVVCPEWHIGPWEPCNKLCGVGNQKRKLKCFKKVDGKIEVLKDDSCPGEKPISEQECTLRPCEGVDWITSSWSGCKNCGLTQETRTAFCAAKSGVVYNETFCVNHPKPELIRPCEATNCKFQWFKSQWSKCSAECGSGVQTRNVVCAQFDGEIIKKTEDESNCEDEKPIDTKECKVETECPGQWFSGPWSQCDKQCGGGTRARKVLCLADGKAVPETQCSKDNIEFSTDECNKIACVEDETIPVDSTAKPIEEDDEGEDYCDEDEEFETSEGLGVIKAAPTDSIDSGIELESSAGTETTLITDDLMFSDATGFESELTDSATDSVMSTIEGSGDTGTDESFSTDGSGDEEDLSTRLSSESAKITESELEISSSSLNTAEIGAATDSISTDIRETSAKVSTETEESSTDSVTSTDLTKDVSGSSETTAAESLVSSLSSEAAGSTSESIKSSGSTSESSSESTSTSESDSTTEESSSSSLSSESSSESSTSSELSSSSIGSSTESTSQAEESSSAGSSLKDTESSSEAISTHELGASTTSSEASSESQSSATETDNGTSALTEITEPSGSSTESGSTVESVSDGETSSSSDLGTSTEAVSESKTETGSTDISSDDVTDSETGSTEISGTEESSQSSIEISTEADEFKSTTIDIWSSTSGQSDLTEEDEGWGNSPNTLEAIITKEQTPRKCKPRPKIAACLKAPFGCCLDNSTTATGPFDEGCPVPETCSETRYGCCPDGVSPAKGNKNKGCPKPLCEGSLFGCCPDGKTEAENEEKEGCPIITTTVAPTTIGGCAASKFGCCPDEISDAKGPNGKGCKEEIESSTDESTDSEIGVTESGTEESVSKKNCTLSQYGCCPDGLSEATGESFHGCAIIDETDCTKSYFGCCSDNKTAARGPNDEGCSPCNSEPFGCCSDGITPAHGRNYEGCCLETPYGCCPDNINPAHGPQLEGCGCQYSPYGCCPDNKTSARGHNNDGCGCEYSPFGCCPDRQTPARGEKYAGCECHTYQFGCCPDGITIPKGPHNYGCHCSHSEFNCCSDGVTHAKGPNFEGCTCATSKYGCCPDGVTDAQGSNYDGCEDIPTSPQKACSLKKDLGSCVNYTIKNFYDSEYGACTRFWYGGCGGNDNRFETNEECASTCEQPEGKAACLLPKVHGPCEQYHTMYYYDSDRNICSQFIYGGCLGNNNRFETVEACQKLCVVDQSLPPCDQPVEPGPCNGTYEQWYYDKETDICRPFIYGGCKGNKNRYPTEHACNYHCKTPGVHKASCALPKETGQCDARHARWHYSQTHKKCMPFYYSGCGGNDNAFVSLEECEAQCPTIVPKDLCFRPAEAGECQNYAVRWYYDTAESRCRQFYYGGCGGNDNNFHDEHSCMARCEQKPTTQAPVQEPPPAPEPGTGREPHPEEGFTQQHCFLDTDSGPCRVSEARWYYNRDEGLCDRFAYGGCGGNQNNFNTEEDCERNCGGAQNPCGLQPVYGRCQENTTRWYYDSRNDACLQFTYSGCRGNKNNFFTEGECRNHCQRRQPPQTSYEHTRAPDISSRFGDQADCNAPVAEGNCNDNILSYFYNRDNGACEQFQYTGCDGNGNRFETLRDCEVSCMETDVCREQVDPGPCDQLVTQYYFNQMSESCEPFTYSGCQGNGNRFNTFSECQSTCIKDTKSKPIDHKAICSLEADGGECHHSQGYQVRRWFYDNRRGTCISFIYNGCDGNQNNFASFESCVDFCTTNEEDNVIDTGNTRTSAPDRCHSAREQCNQMRCPYGISRTYDRAGCEQCECEDPCRGYLCLDDSKCAIDIQPDPELGSAFAPVCRKVNKPGDCPRLSNSTRCIRECYDDADCNGENKCCDSGCNYICVPPYEPQVTHPPGKIHTPYVPLGARPPVLDRKTPEEIDVVQPEGDVATLRCYATGYPPPTVTWKRGTIIINTSQGRYIVTSSGDLQIVQVHRSDSGTYVCIADNGIGAPVEREVGLTVSDPVHGNAYIVGDANSTKIVNLTQPTSIRCLAGGYPKPYVSWFKERDLLPLKSDRHEVNRYALVFSRVELTDLGPYICHAYSGEGKPVSMYVTLKAYGPVQATTKEEEQYLQYIVNPSQESVPTPDVPHRPVRPPTQPEPIDIPTVIEDIQRPSASVPVTTNIILPNGNTFGVGQDITIQCDVQGYPPPQVTWYKDDVELHDTHRIQITDSHRLIIGNAATEDSGYYKCSAQNEFGQSYHAEQINVDGVFVPADCTDNPFFANCKLIIKAKYCTHKYYAKFCCKSCTLAGQLYFSTNLLQ